MSEKTQELYLETRCNGSLCESKCDQGVSFLLAQGCGVNLDLFDPPQRPEQDLCRI